MLLRVLTLCILASISASKEIGLLGHDQEKDPGINRRKKSLFQVPFAPSFIPIDFNMVPFINYENPVFPETAISEDLTGLSGRSPIIKKNPFSFTHMPNFHKKITLSNPPPIAAPLPLPEWNFKFKFPDLMSHFHGGPKKGSQQTEEDEAVAECNEHGGKLVLGECYKLFLETLNYVKARTQCHKTGGDLWTPDLRNPFLFHFIALAFPEIGKADSEEIWFGALNVNSRIITVDGEDVSDAILILADDGDFNFRECAAFDFSYGQLFYDPDICLADNSYICEYPLKKSFDIHKVIG